MMKYALDEDYNKMLTVNPCLAEMYSDTTNKALRVAPPLPTEDFGSSTVSMIVFSDM